MARIENLIGRRFGKLTVEEYDYYHKEREYTYWICKCDCGRIKSVPRVSLISRGVKSCGCLQKKVAANNKKDIVGNRFGKLIVLGDSGKRSKGRAVVWECACDCGNTTESIAGSLRSGKKKSCGCIKGSEEYRQRISEAHKLPISLSSRNGVYNRYRSGARDRELLFTLEKDDFFKLIKQDCFYCGTQPNQVSKGGNGDYVYNGVDRIDSAKGYVIDNCVPCCKACNYGKRTMSQSQFYKWIQTVYTNLCNKKLI